MYKKLVILFSCAVFALSKETLRDQNVQILAENLEVENNIVSASGEVVVFSINHYITARKLIYNKNNATLELFGDVNIVKNNETVSYSQYMFIDLQKEMNNFKPMLVLDNTSKIWFNARNALKDKEYFELKDSTLSSCDCEDPAWSISFSSGNFDTKEQWINTYNTTLYIKDIPILYTPYFGFPTDDTRRTGLLTPTIGYSKNEGLLYAQPFYFAPDAHYDFEYIPQTRLKRGTGHALKFRYVDSLYSDFSFETALFTEKDDYKKKMELTNKRHSGWNLEYNRSKLFSNKNHSDGLLIQSEDMNDVDYINTQYDTDTTDNTDKFLESKIKYYYNTNNYYGDIEIDWYDDISKDNNDDTIQEVPKINLHKYSSGIFDNLLSTSLNVKSTRKTRKVGIGANTTEIAVPISYHTYLWDEYLNFSFTEKINYTNIAYSNEDKKKQDGNYGENSHIFSLYTDLVKPYTDYIHTLNVNLTYTDTNVFQESGDFYDFDNKNTWELSPFPVEKSSNSISIGVSQSIYSKESLQEIINYNISQIYAYNDELKQYEEESVESDLKFNFLYGSFLNRAIFKYDINDFSDSSTTLKLKHDGYFLNLYYSYLKDAETLEKEKTITYNMGFDFLKYYSLSYSEEYDLINKVSQEKEYTFSIDEKCWAIDFKFINSIIASDTTSNINTYRQNILYVEFNLKQLFQMEQKYKFEESK